ncbi:MAG TPA: CTP synthase (glutamine hydrolyzing), partial [Candidatus Thermoplasmatota archaeon]|nr:CTP synthase (glutamine hydrolyzing) [Candidatus Thermoplasmatota archaeon]
VGHENVYLVHTSLVPVVGAVGEQKTKPTQHTVRDLKGIGLHPDMIVCRSTEPLAPEIREKIALFCDVDESAVISAHDARSIYEVPLILEDQGVAETILERFGMKAPRADLSPWQNLVERVLQPSHEVTVAFVGKYTNLSDSYLSINEALRHAGAKLDTRVKIEYIEGEELESHDDEAWRKVRDADAILVGPGFGSRGTEGKIRAVNHARENLVPFLGICLGFQLAIVEFARFECGLKNANSTEMDVNTPHPVITILPEQYEIQNLGGTMRLGAYDCAVLPGTVARDLYGKESITERHRHRYEMNPDYIARMEEKGMVFSGRMPERPIMEIMELPRDMHPYFIGGQFHPEFNSRPNRPGPLFVGLIQAALKQKGILTEGPEPVAAA